MKKISGIMSSMGQTMRRCFASRRAMVGALAVLLAVNIVFAALPASGIFAAGAETPDGGWKQVDLSAATPAELIAQLKAEKNEHTIYQLTYSGREPVELSETIVIEGYTLLMATWDSDVTAVIRRAPSFKGALFEVRNSGDGGSLSVRRMILDGGAKDATPVEAEDALVRLEGGGLILMESSLCSNNNISETANGGAVSMNGGSLSVDGTSSVTGCSAKKGGGVYAAGTAAIEGMIAGNSAEQGGGVYAAGTATIEGMIAGNSAEQGGGIYAAEDSALTLRRSFITNNTAGTSGAGGGGLFLGNNAVLRDQVIINGNFNVSDPTAPAADNVFMNGKSFDYDEAFTGAIGFNGALAAEEVEGAEGDCGLVAQTGMKDDARAEAAIFIPDADGRAVYATGADGKIVAEEDADATYFTVTAQKAAGCTAEVIPSSQRASRNNALLFRAKTAPYGSLSAALDDPTAATLKYDDDLLNGCGCLDEISLKVSGLRKNCTITVSEEKIYGEKTVEDTGKTVSLSGDLVNLAAESITTSAAPDPAKDAAYKNIRDGLLDNIGAQTDVLFEKKLDTGAVDAPQRTFVDTATLTVKLDEDYAGAEVVVCSVFPSLSGQANSLERSLIRTKVGSDGTLALTLCDPFTAAENAVVDPFGGELIVASSVVAQVGTGDSAKKFSSLESAVRSLDGEAGTVYLLGNCTVGETVAIPAATTIRSADDLKPRTISRAPGFKDALFDVASGSLTLCNINVDGYCTEAGGNTNTARSSNSDDLTVEGEDADAPLIIARADTAVSLAGTTSLFGNRNTAGDGGAVQLIGAKLGTVECNALAAADEKLPNDVRITGNLAKNGGAVACLDSGSGADAKHSTIDGAKGVIKIERNSAETGGGVTAADGSALSGVSVVGNIASEKAGGVTCAGDVSLGGFVKITGNKDADGYSDLLLENGKCAKLGEGFDASSRIGFIKPDAAAQLLAEGTGVDAYKDCFFCDRKNFAVEANETKDRLTLSATEDEANYRYIMDIVSVGNGEVSPSGYLRTKDGQTLVLTPADGCVVDRVCVYEGVASNSGALKTKLDGTPKKTIEAADITVADGKGTVTVGAADLTPGDNGNTVAAFFRAKDAEYTVRASLSEDSAENGGIVKVGESNGQSTAAAGSSKTLTFTPADRKYDLTAVKVDGKPVAMTDITRNSDDFSYTYTVDNINEDVAVEATFKEVYIERTIEDGGHPEIKASGKLMRDTAAMSVTPIESGTNFDVFKNAVPAGYVLSKAYDIRVGVPSSETTTSSTPAFRDGVDLTFNVGDAYKGQEALVYHINGTTVEKTLKGTVTDAGFVTVGPATSFSPYAVLVPGTPDNGGGGGGEKRISTIDPVTVTTVVGTPPSLPSTVNVRYSDGSTGTAGVVWEVVPSARYATVGSFTVQGTVAGTTVKAFATVTVTGTQPGGGSGGNGGGSEKPVRTHDNIVLYSVMIAVFAVSAAAVIFFAVRRKLRAKKDGQNNTDL